MTEFGCFIDLNSFQFNSNSRSINSNFNSKNVVVFYHNMTRNSELNSNGQDRHSFFLFFYNRRNFNENEVTMN
jgi:hypothetical protein